jgi:ubiquinone/menaquinone biosynthesis C-methylase UbiE
VEFLTNVKYIEKYLKEGDRILDIGAGAGEYSFYFARKGHSVSALELTDANIKAFRAKMREEDSIELTQGNAVDLSMYEDKSFDIVLLFGPLYHLHSESDRQKCISEAKRVCKDEGMIFFSFIGNDMVILTELDYDKDYLLGDSYDHESFKVEDFPFVFFTVDACKKNASRRWHQDRSRGGKRRYQRANGGKNKRSRRRELRAISALSFLYLRKARILRYEQPFAFCGKIKFGRPFQKGLPRFYQ